MLKVQLLVLVLVLVPHNMRRAIPTHGMMLPDKTHCSLPSHLYHGTVLIYNSRQQRRQVLADRRRKSDERDGAGEAQPLWDSWDLRKGPPPPLIG